MLILKLLFVSLFVILAIALFIVYAYEEMEKEKEVDLKLRRINLKLKNLQREHHAAWQVMLRDIDSSTLAAERNLLMIKHELNSILEQYKREKNLV